MELYNKLFIGGEWVESSSSDMINVINPATEEIWAQVPAGNEADIDRAVAAARDALKGPWGKMTASERSAFLRHIGDLVKEHANELAQVETKENGRLISTTTREAAMLCQWWYYNAGLADKIHGDTIQFENNKHIFTVREPLGVVGAITPWNAPLLMLTWKLSIALAAGNTVVLKPAETTPVTALTFAKLVEKAGLPNGVVNVVTGTGAVAGAHLASHRDVDKIAFTGSGDTARKIMVSATGNIKKLSFELGGKSPHIIFPDADLNAALESAVANGFVHTGQSCALGSRILVHDSIYENFIRQFKEKASKIKVGNPLENVDMGPQAHKKQLDKTLSYIQIGQEEGAKLVMGGNRPDQYEKGYFVNPTVFADVDPSMRIAQEEIFGPVVSMIPFSTEEEALQIANNVTYGLTAGVWTKDLARGHRMAKGLAAGMVWVNTYRYINWVTPYGGYKASGIGKENGLEAVKDFTQVKTVIMDING